MNKEFKKLDLRLSALLRHLDFCDITADVGCDHGKLSLFVLKEGISKHVVCTDISAKCLQKTQNLLNKANLSQCATFIECDGLSGAKNIKIDQIVIAGMGGLNITHILTELPQDMQNAKLVLQPMNNITQVRMALNKLGKKIIRDEIVFDKNKYYHIIVAISGKQKLTLNQIRCGAITEDYRSADYQRWLNYKINKVRTIVSGVSPDNPRYDELCDYLNALCKCKF